MAEFMVNNKVHLATKVLSFIANYERELRIGTNIRRKEKVEKATEFVERIRKDWKEDGVALRKVQEMRRQGDKRQIKVKVWKKGDRVILSIKNLIFKKRLV